MIYNEYRQFHTYPNMYPDIKCVAAENMIQSESEVITVWPITTTK